MFLSYNLCTEVIHVQVFRHPRPKNAMKESKAVHSKEYSLRETITITCGNAAGIPRDFIWKDQASTK